MLFQVALKAKSSEVQALCKQQKEQLEKDRLTIERYSREETHLLRYGFCACVTLSFTRSEFCSNT